MRVTAGARRRILLINPNSSAATSDMMVAIAQAEAGARFQVVGATARRSPDMIVEPVALAAAAVEVVAIALAHQSDVDGIIVAAFGDPGLADLKAACSVPAVGIAESAMLEAAEGGRRFGIATTTPGLVARIDACAHDLGLSAQYAGVRLTDGDPHALVGDPERLRAALAAAVGVSIASDGAQAVIIGGGPLGQAALELKPMFSVPIVAPIPAAVRRLAGLFG